MLRTTIILAGILLVSLAGCASDGEKCCGKCCSQSACTLAENTATHTTTRGIFIDGGLSGYILVFNEVPVGVDAKQITPARTTFIQNLDFENIGFITPAGKLFRFREAKEPVAVYQGSLEENLAAFYELKNAKIVVRDI